MKKITNYKNATVSDIECNGLINPDIIHVVSYLLSDNRKGSIKGVKLDAIRKFLQHHIDKNIPIIFHNGTTFDIPVLEDILEMDLSKLMLIDTLWVSWYLNIKREVHGLDSFFEDYGIEKPKIKEEDWTFVSDCPKETLEHYYRMKHRCETDVAINAALWEDLVERLETMYSFVKSQVDAGNVDGCRMSEDEVRYIDQFKGVSSVEDYIDRLLTFLMFKADCARLQEKTRWKVDVVGLNKLDSTLGELIEIAKQELEGVLPPVPKYVKKNPPAKPFKKDRSISASGQSWNDFLDTLDTLDEQGNVVGYSDENEQCWRLSEYQPPNVNSPDQIKKWLFANGWKPKTFKWVKDKKAMELWVESGFRKELKPKPRGIPQINIDGDEGKELCPSVVKLSEEIPEVMAYNRYSLIKHRYDMIQGFKRDLSEDGYLRARIGGLTNTMRVKHRELTNLPSINKPWGKEIRGLFSCKEGNIQLGTDLSGLEDRTKHDFMLPHDPDYVATMMDEDYDAHISTALTADMITREQFDLFMGMDEKTRSDPSVKLARSKGKSTNYSSVYNIGADALARDLGVPVTEAKNLLNAYWELNWSVKVIAEEQLVFEDAYGKWLINPVNAFCYSLRKESDRFSTLCQGTGSFYFDMWLSYVLDEMQERWGTKVLNGSFHDEFITNFKDTQKFRDIMKGIVLDSIEKVNKTFFLRRKLGCDVPIWTNIRRYTLK